MGLRLVLVVVCTALAALLWVVRVAVAQGGADPEITSAAFEVREGETAVAELTAADTAVESLVWSKTGGVDAAKFSLGTDGALEFVEAQDFEEPGDSDSDGVYEVSVQVSDATNIDSADVVVTLVNVVELIDTIEGPQTVTFVENTATRVATFAASSEQDRDGIVWTLAGDDAQHFSIDSPAGVLRFDIDPTAPRLFAEPPDFEAPVDDDEDNAYELTLSAQVGSESSMSLSVTVTVTDVDEDGTVSRSSARPRVGMELSAELSEP